ncbi:MAG: efflux RND transporter periplasmic adaptor subunit [Spirochaetia bacterium]|nr:efflux RND transporter periplasmic adaptor subunit [Spirochaetia bacterium]
MSVGSFKMSSLRFEPETVFRNSAKWLKGHAILAIVGLVGAISILLGARYIIQRSEGILSEPIATGTIVRSVYGIGSVMANRSYQLKLAIVNNLNEIYVKEGDSVPKNGRLVLIDGIPYSAPFAGTITFLPYRIGENVFASVPVLTLVDLRDRYIVASLEQQGALQVQKGQTVRMSFDTIRDHYYTGTVSAIYSNENQFLARIDVRDLPAQVLPGMTADVAISIQERKDALLVPVAALEGKSVWRKRGHEIPRLIEVQIGIVDREFAEIEKGDLAAGDRVLIKTRVP